MRRGFTLIELLLAMAVVAVLVTAFGASAHLWLARSKVRKAWQQVSLISGAIAAHPTRTWAKQIPVPKSGPPSHYEQAHFVLWDMDRDSILDGTVLSDESLRETKDDKADLADETKIPYDYRGFVETTRFRHNPKDLDPSGRLIDPWGNPYRVAMRLNEPDPAVWNARFGGGTTGQDLWYAVWSCGPDGKDGTKDDITSWRNP